MKIVNVWILTMTAMIITLAGNTTLAKDFPAETNLVAALTKAGTEKKFLFVQYGREACGNCQALKSMIRKKDVKLSQVDFVYADVNCDDPATSQAFRSRFKVEGSTLPFVVIADPTGKQLASHTGWGSASEFTDFIKNTKRAYDKEQKALPAPPMMPVAPPKPKTFGIALNETRETRSWTATSGDKVMAAVVEERAGVLILKKEDGTKIKLSRTLLSKEDQDYLDQLRQDESKTAEQ